MEEKLNTKIIQPTIYKDENFILKTVLGKNDELQVTTANLESAAHCGFCHQFVFGHETILQATIWSGNIQKIKAFFFFGH